MFANRPRLAGTLVGLAVAVASTYLTFRTDIARRLELQAFDLRMQKCNTLEAKSPIVHIDIDDGSLDRIGRWPWHRDVTADLIRTLGDLGASYVMVDLLFSEPESPYIDPRLFGESLEQNPEAVVGELSASNLIFPDLELADALRRAGNVIMATQMSTSPPGTPPPLFDRLRKLREGEPNLDRGTVLARLGLEDSPGARARIDREMLRIRMLEFLLREFTLTEAELVQLLGVEAAQVRAVFAGVKKMAADELVTRELAADARKSWSEVAASVLGDAMNRRNADTADLQRAYSAGVGRLLMRKGMHPFDADAASRLSTATSLVPLEHVLAEAAADIAAVNFKSDVDGVVRRVPLLIQYENHVVEHMGFAAAARIMGLDVERASIDASNILSVPRTDGGDAIRLPLDANGNLIIHWTRSAARWHRGEDFPHIPAAKIWTIADARRKLAENAIARRYLMAELVSIAKGEVTRIEGEGENQRRIRIPGDIAYRQKFRRRAEVEQRVHFLEIGPSPDATAIDALKAELSALQDEIGQEEESAVVMVRRNIEMLASFPMPEGESDPETDAEVNRIRRGGRIMDENLPALDAADEGLRAIIDATRAELLPVIQGKYIFIGYAATAEGDIVSTPIAPQTNGVMCHAQVLNSILQQRFIQLPSPWIGIAACLGLGLLSGVITATRGPAAALGATVTILFTYSVLNAYWIFQATSTWLEWVPLLITVSLCWAFVTLFRQLTAERDKRLFRKQLSQYTSPAIAAKIAESPEAARAFKAVQTRDMTCIFSDLKGFTTITERENAQVVQRVLNVYLERMCNAIWKHRGLINKFMGDGIMAFFNPSVDPLEDHARSACEASLTAMEELTKLKHERQASGDAEVFKVLEMRVGLASGPCMNGDMGSELKADYTIIGDVVNLAARLEPANKVFGTSILVSGALRERVKDAYEFRYLAELQVKGKAKTVPVFEIMGRKGEVDPPQLEYARRFEAGVELYKARKWDECIVHFTRILARRPDDAGASRYVDACQELKTFPPGEKWTGALELKEK